MILNNIALWHRRARPNPTPADFSVQLGCHLEEFAEMLATLVDTSGGITVLRVEVEHVAGLMKRGELRPTIKNRMEFLDSLADQIVTAVGAGHCAGMQTVVACGRVNASNWSKFDDSGQPIFNDHGKITKGPGYQPPNLTGLHEAST
jgi:hypothetical protein